MCFPFWALGGNYVPESSSGVGCAFRLKPQAETASRNPRLEWDALSGTALNRKLRPGIRCQNGICFPNRLQAEIASHSESSFWDTLSARSFVRKAHPVPSSYSGTHFPVVIHLETASQFERLFRDTFSARPAIRNVHPVLSVQTGTRFPLAWPLGKRGPDRGGMRFGDARPSGSYSSTSLSHVGSMVWRMPAVCSFFASMPAERTSIMVKRMSGWP